MLAVTKTGNWKLYWGTMPLPAGAEALGLVKRDTGTGALIRLSNGNYVQGNAGGIRTLPQREVDEALSRSNAASALRSIPSQKRSDASRENGKKGGRPRKNPNEQSR